jgi:tRNA dimethylallyltransferase
MNHGGGQAVPVLVLFGPTASGKTELLFRLFGGACGESSLAAEIVSADSMQVYRGMDIGTAKPGAEERAALVHHLIDICEPDEQFTAGDFVRRASAACQDIFRRGKLPVIAGGAGFYLKTMLTGLPAAPPADAEIRGRLQQELREQGAPALMAELVRLDPASAGRIHINDEYRLLRALEVCRASGRPLSSFSGAPDAPPVPFHFLRIGLSRPREALYRRIDERCRDMFRRGLPAEVERLYAAGYTPRDSGMRAIGYREFFVEAWDAGPDEPGRYRLSQDHAGVEALVARNSRRYAKRQLTFFASIPDVLWIAAGESGAADRIQTALRDFLRTVTTPPPAPEEPKLTTE